MRCVHCLRLLKPADMISLPGRRSLRQIWLGASRGLLLSGIAVKMSKPTNAAETSPLHTPRVVQEAVRTSHILRKLQMAIIQAIVFFIRLTRYIILITPIVLTLPALYMGQGPRAMWYSLSLKMTEYCGAAALKLAQWASTRPDLFSAEFCETFSKLQRHVEAHSFSYTKYKLKKYFGKHWRKAIKYLEPKPLGSGCVAQVHKAYLDLSCIDETIADSIREDMQNIDTADDMDWFDAFEVLGFHQDLSSGDDDSPEHELQQDENLIPIAIKVLHPGVRQEITSDLSVLKYLAWLGETLVPPLRYLNLVECVREFSVTMKQQLDLRLEADNYLTFGDLFADDPDVRFPHPIKPYIWRDLIIQSLEEGTPIHRFLTAHNQDPTDTTQQSTDQPITDHNTNSDNQSQDSYDMTSDPVVRQRLADMGLNTLFKMIFEYNFVHADLHPGNISVQVASGPPVNQEQKVELVDLFDSTMITVVPRDNPLTLVLYDCGLVTSLPSFKQKSITDVFTAIVLADGERVGELFIEHSVTSPTTDKQAFITDMSNLIDNYTAEGVLNLKNVKVGELFGDFFSILSRHRVRLDSSFVNVMIAVVMVEGLGRGLNPDMDILHTLRKYLIKV